MILFRYRAPGLPPEHSKYSRIFTKDFHLPALLPQYRPFLPPCCVQELVTYTHSCKKCLSVIERSHQSLQKTLDSSRTLQHMQTTLLQKRVADLQSSSQVQPHGPRQFRTGPLEVSRDVLESVGVSFSI